MASKNEPFRGVPVKPVDSVPTKEERLGVDCARQLAVVGDQPVVVRKRVVEIVPTFAIGQETQSQVAFCSNSQRVRAFANDMGPRVDAEHGVPKDDAKDDTAVEKSRQSVTVPETRSNSGSSKAKSEGEGCKEAVLKAKDNVRVKVLVVDEFETLVARLLKDPAFQMNESGSAFGRAESGA